MFSVAAAVAIALILGAAAEGRADVILWAAANNGAFGTVDVQTGAFTQTGTLTGVAAGQLGGMALSPRGTLYTQLSDQNLATVDPGTATVTTVGSTGANNIFGIRFRSDGVLFGASHTDLFTIDPTTGTATHVGALGVGISSYFDLVFDDHDNLFMTQSTDTVYRLDTTTGAATAVGSVGFFIVGAAFADGTLYATTTDSKIITVDTTTGAGAALSTQTPSGTFIFTIANGPAPVDGGDGDAGESGHADASAGDGETDAEVSADAGAPRTSSSGGCSCGLASRSLSHPGISVLIVAAAFVFRRRRDGVAAHATPAAQCPRLISGG
ncbi:MAG TPA: hypothetical protein VH374_01635 [Polyangia bacterium]|nr:hypothetical protein [Polyangia bacterium]